ncbi:uncharacterized protein BO88DRAFT_202734 [Aspergillus vadensis CBS 113365]|uniref:Uncharacterized protein n=1 Tax=Aspergillus vadensis (strain CBS 113365 / IMI 142717 / IBT 24658) TaxID=1448311 RepID=A0A319BH56_ASPVC|nr:hypothetical protein BO88DRAFT_202734 [Aspergillus vadensis CBS 113365]PYH71957.1 hypothetical protein BO88DRAFT_202734 [Aspergillus vadensis CBS 113365]
MGFLFIFPPFELQIPQASHSSLRESQCGRWFLTRNETRVGWFPFLHRPSRFPFPFPTKPGSSTATTTYQLILLLLVTTITIYYYHRYSPAKNTLRLPKLQYNRYHSRLLPLLALHSFYSLFSSSPSPLFPSLSFPPPPPFNQIHLLHTSPWNYNATSGYTSIFPSVQLDSVIFPPGTGTPARHPTPSALSLPGSSTTYYYLPLPLLPLHRQSPS